MKKIIYILAFIPCVAYGSFSYKKESSNFILPTSFKPAYHRKACKSITYSQKIYSQNTIRGTAKMAWLTIGDYEFNIRKLSTDGAIEEEHLHILFIP